MEVERSNGPERIHESLLGNVVYYTIAFSIITVVSYMAVLYPSQPPHHNNSDYMHHSSMWQKLFFSFNTLSFFFSLCGLLISANLTFSRFTVSYTYSSISLEKEFALQLQRLAIVLTNFMFMATFLTVSLMSCATAFLSAGLATIAGGEEGRTKRKAVAIVGALGSWVFLQAVFVFARDLLSFWKEVRVSHVQLWEAMKTATVFGRVWSWYVEMLMESRTHKNNELS